MNKKQTMVQAEGLVRNAVIMVLATIDSLGFASQAALIPLTYNRSLRSIWLYTDSRREFVSDISRLNQVSLFTYEENGYSSLAMKGQVRVVPESNLEQAVKAEVNTFQKEFNYKTPIILKFSTLSFKLRHNNEITAEALDNLNLL